MAHPQLYMLIVRHLAAAEEVERHAAGHIAYLEKWHAAGVFILSGQTVPPETGGVIVARGVGPEQIERIVAEDVFVRRGLSAYEIVTMTARRRHPALESLLQEHVPGGPA